MVYSRHLILLLIVVCTIILLAFYFIWDGAAKKDDLFGIWYASYEHTDVSPFLAVEIVSIDSIVLYYAINIFTTLPYKRHRDNIYVSDWPIPLSISTSGNHDTLIIGETKYTKRVSITPLLKSEDFKAKKIQDAGQVIPAEIYLSQNSLHFSFWKSDESGLLLANRNSIVSLTDFLQINRSYRRNRCFDLYIHIGNTIELKDVAWLYLDLLNFGTGDCATDVHLVFDTNINGDFTFFCDNIHQFWGDVVYQDSFHPPITLNSFSACLSKRHDLLQQADELLFINSSKDIDSLNTLLPYKHYLVSFSDQLSIEEYIRAKQLCHKASTKARIVTEIRITD